MFRFMKKAKKELKEYIQKLESDDCTITAPPESMFESVANAAAKEGKTSSEYMKAHNVNSFGESLDKLIDGELPWGWISANKEFTDKIEKEYSYFWKSWIDEKDGEPAKEKNALKSLLQYMDDVQKMCNKKGECFGFWCSEYLIGSQKKRCASRLADLGKE